MDEQEPFIYIREDTEMPFGGYEHCGQHDAGAFPVYLAPPHATKKVDMLPKAFAETPTEASPVANSTWVGLTHDEVDSWELPDCPTVFEFAKFIEAKLKEKNT